MFTLPKIICLIASCGHTAFGGSVFNGWKKLRNKVYSNFLYVLRLHNTVRLKIQNPLFGNNVTTEGLTWKLNSCLRIRLSSTLVGICIFPLITGNNTNIKDNLTIAYSKMGSFSIEKLALKNPWFKNCRLAIILYISTTQVGVRQIPIMPIKPNQVAYMQQVVAAPIL